MAPSSIPHPGSADPAPSTGRAAKVLVARQPIFDRKLAVHAYELLFRGSSEGGPDPERWTASLLIDALTEMGMHNLVGDRLAYLNVTRRFLLDVDPLPFGPEGVVLELTEDSHHTDPALLARLRDLVADGYRIALDDFSYDASLSALVELASVVKLDVLADGLEVTAQRVQQLRPFGVELLAEKVETPEAFELCRELGFDTFQGYFFARPRLISGTGVAANEVAALNTLAELTRPGLSFEELERIIATDIGLSYKLLRYINSGFFSLARRVDTVRDTLVLLGERPARQWATVMAFAGASRRPPELVALALLRARLCQQVAAAHGEPSEESCFMAGLFSVVDALLEVPMEQALARLPFSQDLNDALLSHSGPIGEVLGGVVAIGRGRFGVLDRLAADSYGKASSWADSAMRAAELHHQPTA